MTVTTDPRKTGISAGSTLLAASAATGMAVTGTTSETALATIPLPALGPNSQLIVYAMWSTTNSANNKTMRARLGGLAGTAMATTIVTTQNVYRVQYRVANRGVTNSQLSNFTSATGESSGSWGVRGGGESLITAAVDTSVSVSLVLSGQLANSGETIALESYEVWLLP